MAHAWRRSLLQVAAVLSMWRPAGGCTTVVVAAGATSDGSVITSHSNDGDTFEAANLMRVERASWPAGSTRAVSRGLIPQVEATHAYFTKPGGYASLSEHLVGLAESTCVGVYSGANSSGILNIVDLSALALERATSARSAVLTMGLLAETFGYWDNAESLLVVDPRHAWIFHVLPDSSGRRAIWAAQRVPPHHVAVVANAFTIRAVALDDEENFLYSTTLLEEARILGWSPSEPLCFTRIFSGPEPGHKYASGRRMWAALSLLSSLSAEQLPPSYGELVSDAPYPATAPGKGNLTRQSVARVMRDWYEGTPYDMTNSASTWAVSGGAFNSPDRCGLVYASCVSCPSAIAALASRALPIVCRIFAGDSAH